MNLSETAFFRPGAAGGYDLRWFTPTVEVELCGHATLASAHVLWETERVAEVTFHTRSGELRTAHNDDGSLTLDLPIVEPVPAAPNRALFDTLGLAPTDFLRTDDAWFLCVVDDAAIVRGLAPDPAAMRALPGVDGVYVTAPGDADFDIVSRCFGPGVGIDEDPVTGSMHAALVAYWEPRLGKSDLRAYQASRRGGELIVTRKGDRALLTGFATTVLAGELRA
jgi:PhzF family phenazine biosynthesis protein